MIFAWDFKLKAVRQSWTSVLSGWTLAGLFVSYCFERSIFFLVRSQVLSIPAKRLNQSQKGRHRINHETFVLLNLCDFQVKSQNCARINGNEIGKVRTWKPSIGKNWNQICWNLPEQISFISYSAEFYYRPISRSDVNMFESPWPILALETFGANCSASKNRRIWRFVTLFLKIQSTR